MKYGTLKLGSYGLSLLLVVTMTGCSIGPQTLSRDRVSYGDALANSARQELLKNIVRLRYMESPVFVSINSVVNQYALETTVNAGASWNWGGQFAGTGNAIGATSRFSDRPTITYSPLVGKRYTESIITPIKPASLMSLIESGWKVERIFPLMVHSINGIRNRFYAGSTTQELDPKFKQIVDLMAEMQNDGTISIRVQKSTDDEKPSFVFIFSGAHNVEEEGQIGELKALLGLAPDAERYRIVFGSAARDDTEVAIVTRSILAVLADMSSYVRVPEEHMAEGRALPGAPHGEGMSFPLIVQSGTNEPEDAFIKIQHRDIWFWIEDTDMQSKRTFLQLVIFSTLAESPDAAQTPLLTIPA
ncbi:MAG: hypothetical protein O7G85_08725 [Planctomycetota bacterium]|nr:hypothetical protein [Planctomycetota bacterium]